MEYQDVSTEMFLKATTAQGLGTFDIANVRHYARELRGGAFAVGAPTTDVEETTGTPAETEGRLKARNENRGG